MSVQRYAIEALGQDALGWHEVPRAAVERLPRSIVTRPRLHRPAVALSTIDRAVATGVAVRREQRPVPVVMLRVLMRMAVTMHIALSPRFMARRDCTAGQDDQKAGDGEGWTGQGQAAANRALTARTWRTVSGVSPLEL